MTVSYVIKWPTKPSNDVQLCSFL